MDRLEKLIKFIPGRSLDSYYFRLRFSLGMAYLPSFFIVRLGDAHTVIRDFEFGLAGSPPALLLKRDRRISHVQGDL